MLSLRREGVLPVQLAAVEQAREVNVVASGPELKATIAPRTLPARASGWSVSDDYRISRYERGRVVQQFQRRVQWFRRSTDGSGRAWRVRDFHVDARGVLWVAMSGFTRERKGQPRTLAELYLREPTYIEAIDLAGMRVLANGTLTGSWIGGFLPDGRIYAVSDSREGGARVDLWRPVLTAAAARDVFGPTH